MLQTRSILRQKASLYEKLQERRSRRFYLIQRGRSPFGEYNHQSIERAKNDLKTSDYKWKVTEITQEFLLAERKRATTQYSTWQDTQAHLSLFRLATYRLGILDNISDFVAKCLLSSFKGVEQGKFHHACYSKKNCSSLDYPANKPSKSVFHNLHHQNNKEYPYHT